MQWLLAVGAGVVLLATIGFLGETDTEPTWSVTRKIDPISGQTIAYASSPNSKPVRKREFPYGGIQMAIGFACDTDSEWGYLTFTETPNLIYDEIKDGYSLSLSRVRWDNVFYNRVELLQWRGEKALRFVNKARAIGDMMRYNTMLVELDWYGLGKVYFEATLAGSTAAISQARTICRPHIRRNQAR